MNNLNQHYRQLLGLDASWNVDDVDLDLSKNQVVIQLSHAGGPLCCPECKDGACSRADTAPERTWRHLDTMQFKTEIKAAVPRSKCKKCGVKTIAVPWAGKHWLIRRKSARIVSSRKSRISLHISESFPVSLPPSPSLRSSPRVFRGRSEGDGGQGQSLLSETEPRFQMLEISNSCPRARFRRMNPNILDSH